MELATIMIRAGSALASPVASEPRRLHNPFLATREVRLAKAATAGGSTAPRRQLRATRAAGRRRLAAPTPLRAKQGTDEPGREEGEDKPSGEAAQPVSNRRALVVQAAALGPELSNSSAGGSASGSLLSVFCPLLKVIAGDDPSAPRNRTAEVATSGFASIARLPFGTSVGPAGLDPNSSRPEEPLRLYEFEACPFCRRTREAITDLDLDVMVFPCPKGSVRHRQEVMRSGGREQFPFLEDPNTGQSLYESEDIVRYLYTTYGAGAEPPTYLLPSTLVSGWVPTLLRAGRGMTRWEEAVTDAPAQPLELWNYDGNQFARLVREALCELELPYVSRAAGKGSKNREQLHAISGATKVPYLVDPNTGASMGESETIIAYLFKTYRGSS